MIYGDTFAASESPKLRAVNRSEVLAGAAYFCPQLVVSYSTIWPSKAAPPGKHFARAGVSWQGSLHVASVLCGVNSPSCEFAVCFPSAALPSLVSIKLLDRVRERIRLLHYSLRTEEVDVHWTRAFVRYHGSRRLNELGRDEVAMPEVLARKFPRKG